MYYMTKKIADNCSKLKTKKVFCIRSTGSDAMCVRSTLFFRVYRTHEIRVFPCDTAPSSVGLSCYKHPLHDQNNNIVVRAMIYNSRVDRA